jgi:hypothetical protein
MWSKLIETPIGYYAENIMRRNNCGYHNWDHIIAMFNYLEENNYPYDIDLDAAILYHDSVYDNQPDKEIRSSELFYDYCKMYPDRFAITHQNTVHLLIMETIDHSIKKGSDEVSRAIIRADLHGLADGETTFMNYHKIMNESIQLYNIDRKTFATNNIEFMISLQGRISYNIINDHKNYEHFWQNVLKGIDDTITMSQIILRE